MIYKTCVTCGVYRPLDQFTFKRFQTPGRERPEDASADCVICQQAGKPLPEQDFNVEWPR